MRGSELIHILHHYLLLLVILIVASSVCQVVSHGFTLMFNNVEHLSSVYYWAFVVSSFGEISLQILIFN